MKKRMRADEDEEKLELIEDSHIKSRMSVDTTPQTTLSLSEDSSSDRTTSTSDDDDNEFHMSEDDDVDTCKAENKIEQMGSDNGNGERVKVEVDAQAQAQAQPQPQKNGNGHGNGERGIMGPRFRDFGGIDSVIEELKMEVIVPLYHRELPRCLGVQPISGILLHGPPGCGNTKLAHATANETGFPFHMISFTGIISALSGMHFLFIIINVSFFYNTLAQ